MEKNNNKWRRAVSLWLDYCIDNSVEQIENLARNGKIECWREITLSKGEVPDPTRHPGIFWSHEKNAAEAHWSQGDLITSGFTMQKFL